MVGVRFSGQRREGVCLFIYLEKVRVAGLVEVDVVVA